MDFFERQEQARKKTKWLVLYFILAVVLTTVAIYGAMVSVFFFQAAKHRNAFSFWNPTIFLWTAGGTLAVIVIGSLIKMAELSKGGGAVATALGGRPVPPDPQDPDERKLRNVVEEMAIASGVPVPEIYVLDSESGINAFAAGHSTTDAAIGVTRGAIHLLSRDELQGVIAHEFSHILNGDMRLNLRLMGWVYGIICLTIVGRIILRSMTRSSRSSKKNNPAGAIALFGLALLIFGAIGAFFGKLIKSAVSRQREFLADAAAVQFTRNPLGLAGALKKIGGLAYGSRLETPAAEEASHMFFGNGIESWFSLMATHPPLDQRIKLLDPAFDGSFSKIAADLPSIADDDLEFFTQKAPPIPTAPIRPPRLNDLIGSHNVPPPFPAHSALADVGAPTALHLNYATQSIQSLPQKLAASAREPFGATAIVYALLLSEDSATRNSQLETLRANCPEAILTEVQRLESEVQQMDEGSKLPLLELSVPALRQLSRPQFEQFNRNIKLLIEADRQVSLFEYALQKMLRRHLESYFFQTPKPVVQYYVLKKLNAECSILLSALAHAGHPDPIEINSAFQLGADKLNFNPSEIRLFEIEECTLQKLDEALDRLAQTAAICKKQFLEACAQTVAADGIIQAREGELLRAMADALDCPIPPFVVAANG